VLIGARDTKHQPPKTPAGSVGGSVMSIVRIGLGETDKFGEGYEAIFGKKKTTKPKKAQVSVRKTSKKKKKKPAKK
jgi:hypothetical protein